VASQQWNPNHACSSGSRAAPPLFALRRAIRPEQRVPEGWGGVSGVSPESRRGSTARIAGQIVTRIVERTHGMYAIARHLDADLLRRLEQGSVQRGDGGSGGAEGAQGAADVTNTVVIDMSQVEELNTAELAELVALRQRLLHSGRDLQLVGLRGRAKALYDLTHLAAVLPAAAL
jgi:ABC-type transporter Mla MlaB component